MRLLKKLAFFAIISFLGIALSMQANSALAKDTDILLQVASPDEGGAWLGVQIKELTRHLRKELDTKARFGVVVDNVLDNSPAADAGIEPGDVIVRFDGKMIRRVKGLTRAISKKHPDEDVMIELMRGNDRKKIAVTLGERPGNQGWAFDEPAFEFGRAPSTFLGIEVQEMDDNLAGYFNVDANEGLLVTAVEKDSPAEKSGIESGDIITAIGAKEVRKVEDVRDILKGHKKGDRLELHYIRKGEDKSTTVELESHPNSLGYFKNFRFPSNIRIAPFLAPQLRKQYKEDLQRTREELDEWRNEYRQETKKRIEREVEKAMEKKERELKQMKNELEKMKKEMQQMRERIK